MVVEGWSEDVVEQCSVARNCSRYVFLLFMVMLGNLPLPRFLLYGGELTGFIASGRMDLEAIIPCSYKKNTATKYRDTAGK